MLNLATRYSRITTVDTRKAEVTAADFDGGVNPAAANSGCIGICTGNANPKAGDFSLSPLSTNQASYIGGKGLADGDRVQTAMIAGADKEPKFFLAAADVVNGGDLGGGYLNLTGVTVKSGEHAWGVK